MPILFLGDGPDQHTGLGRLGRDLACLVASMPEFRVGYLGRGAFGSLKFPFQMYTYDARDQWGEHKIQRAWEDFSRGDYGVIMTLWDASRLLWFARPEYGLEEYPRLKGFLTGEQFERWGYFMVDGHGMGGGLPAAQAETLGGYARVVVASKWGYEIVKNSYENMGEDWLDWIPHPINGEVFKFDKDRRAYARSMWGVEKGEQVIGIVMTNQARKYWGPALMAVKHYISTTGAPVKLWLHYDRELNHWNIPALVSELGLEDMVLPGSRSLDDKGLAIRYGGCDCTLVLSGGEGFCYPAAESLACGVPVVSGTYGAQDELLAYSGQWRVNPAVKRVDTIHNVVRAEYNYRDVAEALKLCLAERWDEERAVKISATMDHLSMMKLGLVWKKWFREGIKAYEPR